MKLYVHYNTNLPTEHNVSLCLYCTSHILTDVDVRVASVLRTVVIGFCHSCGLSDTLGFDNVALCEHHLDNGDINDPHFAELQSVKQELLACEFRER